ncbi:MULTISPECIES: hypothetical protein [unclassified Bradyrhizobium]|uniref:hypothetical protein n=1 Tax=Bradyrhizobium sp. USDA 4541 TaxID=2817704 RepID=UPI0020A45162|nr:hypothetical protein [Bradyrhizobium sp. USDA 4541]MCP1852743.1 hypothetical protein [Bradyrhizobium sp. USDA 4541]
MERNGYFDHPDQGVAWLVSVVAGLAQSHWFYPLLAFLFGLSIGLWADRVLRRLANEQGGELTNLGRSLRGMAESVRQSQGGFRSTWPENVEHLRGPLESYFLTLKSDWKIAPLPASVFELNHGAQILIEYLDHVGSHLMGRQLKAAQNKARNLAAEIG